MKERLLKYAKYAPIVGYPLFYVVCLLVFLSVTFPYDKLRERLVGGFNADQRANSGKQELQVDEMHGYWLSGVRLKGVRLLTLPAEPGKPPQKLDIEEATARYAILPALIGHSDLSFDVNAFGGKLRGRTTWRGATNRWTSSSTRLRSATSIRWSRSSACRFAESSAAPSGS